MPRKANPGVDDLNVVHPVLVSQWHPTKNFPALPKDFLPGSKTEVWWVDSHGHEWKARIQSRVAGQNCPYCSGTKVLAGFNDLRTTHPEIVKEWHPTRNDIKIEAVSAGAHYNAWWVCSQGHEWQSRVDYRLSKGKVKECRICKASHPKVSKRKRTNPVAPAMTQLKVAKSLNPSDLNSIEAEKEIVEFLKSRNVKVEENVRNIMDNNLELDIYLPDHNIAIEYNGLRWHTEEAGKDKWYHYTKWIACKEKGIQLLQIWEDDWIKNPERILLTIETKLGIKSAGKVYARKTTVTLLSKKVAEKFLDNNHLQGFASGSYYLGLKSVTDNTVVAVMVLRNEPGTEGEALNIIRYATSTTVPGGFTKLLKYAETNYHPKQFITFSDHTVSDGGLYENNGFEAVKELDPDYMYVVKGERKHKFGYRLKRFRNDPELQYVEGYTESQLAKLNNLPRIWDAGKTKWVKVI